MSELGPSLGKKAFGEHADPGLVVAYRSHLDALQFLADALRRDAGIALLQGPRGSGKSTIAREQHLWSSRDAAAALIDGVNLTPRKLLTGMLSQFGVETIPQYDEQILQVVNNFLNRQAGTSRTPVLIVDDFDRATSSAQRMLNWLAALEVQRRYALRIILTGRERLDLLTQEASMRNLGRRNPLACTLNPLTEQEALIYLHTRLIAAGGEHCEKVFPVEVAARLHESSHGWPGRLDECALQALDRIGELQAGRMVPSVIVTCDGETVGEYELTKSQYVIGRAELADIVLEDNYVSKLHALLQVYSNAIVLLDLNSTNGTTVNSAQVPKTLLRNNDIISLGRHRLKVVNAPPISPEMDARVSAADTLTLQNPADLRLLRARRTIVAMKHR